MLGLDIYTDGSCHRETGIGGWGLAWFSPSGTKLGDRCGNALDTTNNRMELQAVIEACKLTVEIMPPPDYTTVSIITDSLYVKNGLVKWIHDWKSLGWRSRTGEVKNLDQWKEAYDLYYLQLKGRVPLYWVKGHSGVPGNELADQLAEKARTDLNRDVLTRKLEVLKARTRKLESLLEEWELLNSRSK